MSEVYDTVIVANEDHLKEIKRIKIQKDNYKEKFREE